MAAGEAREVKPKKWWAALALVATLMAAGLWSGYPRHATEGGTVPAPRADGVASWFRQGSPAGGPPIAGAASEADAASAPNGRQPASPLDTMILPTFRATDKGSLAMDQQTRLDVERIHALFPRDEALAKLDSQSSGLPAQAQRELKQLYQQYSQYAQAVAQSYPPGLSNGTLEEATQQLKGLHDLRQQYFGVEGAEALFGEEEKTSHTLLDLMRKQTDPKLSLEEKAELAQAEWKKNQPVAKP